MIRNKILSEVRAHQKFLIASHVNPDPDALCSQLAMAGFLKALGKKAVVVSEDEVADRFKFLPGTKQVKTVKQLHRKKFDVVIVLDCGELKRIGKVEELLTGNELIINIDHHITNDNFGKFNYIDVKASSTGEMLYSLFKAAKFMLNDHIALNLYAGIMTDTGCFRYSNTTPRTHEIISQLCRYSFSPTNLYKRFYESISLKDLKEFTKVVSGFKESFNNRVVMIELSKRTLKKFSDSFDLRDAIFKHLRLIEEAQVFVIFTEDTKNSTRVNFRSAGQVNVAAIAQKFNGGGHHNASGCCIDQSVMAAKTKVNKELKKVLK